MDMTDVRKALWRAYKKIGIEEKRMPVEEGYCELQYPSLEDADYNEEKFLRPTGVFIYSPTLLSKESCYVEQGDEECKINDYAWQAPDIFKKAVDLIDLWADDLKEE